MKRSICLVPYRYVSPFFMVPLFLRELLNSIFLPTRNGFFAYPLQNRLLSLLLGSNLCGEVLDQTHSGEQNLCHSRATANPFQVAMAAQQSLSLVMCDIVPSILARNIVQH
jgi:hypothetical protein